MGAHDVRHREHHQAFVGALNLKLAEDDTFMRLGAEPWAERARHELRAAANGSPHPDSAATGHLTPQELQIALLAASGKTNREIAASIFLSHKTIEGHLGRVYRKLSVCSRTELVHVINPTSDDHAGRLALGACPSKLGPGVPGAVTGW